MLAKTGKQYRMMAMAAHDEEAAKRVGVPMHTAKEFVKKTPAKKRKQFSKGKRT